MATEAKLVATKRTKLGTAESRRLRRSGRIPGNIYGHEQEPVAFAVAADDLTPIIHSGAHVVDLEMDGQVEKAIVREVQWDTFSTRIQHVDLLRVDPNERVSVDVAIVLRGTAPGAVAGGILDHALHALTIDCPAIQIPDRITVRINALEIGDAIHVSDLEIPPGTNVDVPGDTLVVRVLAPIEEVAPEEAEAGVAEPELVRRREEEGGGA